MVALQGHDPAALVARAGRERLHAGRIAALEDAVRQVAESPLDVRDPDLQDQLEAGQPSVVAGHRPGAGLEAAGIVGEVQLFQGERERVAGGKPARPVRPNAGDQPGLHIKEGGARPAREPLQAAADERVAIHRADVDGHAPTCLVAVDQA